jgi:hypothetical protein
MDVRIVGYNRKRRQDQRSRRYKWREELLRAYGRYGAMAALARRLGVHRSTILKDCRRSSLKSPAHSSRPRRIPQPCNDYSDGCPSIRAPLSHARSPGVCIAAGLHDPIDIHHEIHGSPQVMAPAVDGRKHLVEMSFVPGPRPSTPQLVGVILTELETPLTEGLAGHVDAAFEQQLLHVAVTQGKALVEPDPMADDFAGKAVVLVTLSVGWRGHAWRPILVFD